jgi:hypothetical protein
MASSHSGVSIIVRLLRLLELSILCMHPLNSSKLRYDKNAGSFGLVEFNLNKKSSIPST